MRSILLAALLSLALLPSIAAAKAWRGVTPGTSTIEEVINKFGEPTKRSKQVTRSVLVYAGDQALQGTKETQFQAREDGVVLTITVFLATELEKESIEGTYGKSPRKTFTDEFLPVWRYDEGITVFFTKDGFVNAISFAEGRSAAKEPGAKEPAAKPGKKGAPAPAPAKSELLP